MNLGEKVECEDDGTVCGLETGRVVAKFSHVSEAEAFVELVNNLEDSRNRGWLV